MTAQKITLTSAKASQTLVLKPGYTHQITVKPSGTGTVTINDADGDALDASLTAVAATVRKTFEAGAGEASLTAVANGPDGTTAHVVKLIAVKQ